MNDNERDQLEDTTAQTAAMFKRKLVTCKISSIKMS